MDHVCPLRYVSVRLFVPLSQKPLEKTLINQGAFFVSEELGLSKSLDIMLTRIEYIFK